MQPLSIHSTDSFPPLLDQAIAAIVLAFRSAGKLAIVRRSHDGLNTHFLDMRDPNGIAWKPGELAIGASDAIEVFRNLTAAGPKTGHGELVDACYIPRRTHRTGAIDVHEAKYDGEGTLWLTCTRMSCLATLSEEFSFVPRWRPPFISAYDLNDRCRLTGFALRDGRPRYASMLGATDSTEGWRSGRVSGGLLMDVEENEVVADQLCMPHSPRWHQDRLWFLAAGAGQLLCTRPGGTPFVVAEVPGFARGLDFIDRYALIGVSRMRANAAFAGLPLARHVDNRRCGVWVVDTRNGAIVAFIEFTGGLDEVFDLKVLPHRYPAVLEISNPLIATSYEVPDEVLANLAPPDPVQLALETATRSHLEGQLDDALHGYRAILEKQPDHRLASHRLGLCLVDAERWHEAVDQLNRVAESQPENAEAMNSLGLAWYRLGELERGLEWIDRALAADPDFPLAHLNRGIILLKFGRYREAWPEYDWRWRTNRFVPFQCSQPEWRGEDISAKRLLVHSEQGNGDQFQFMRFLPLVAEKCRELIYVGPESLAPLVEKIPGVAESRVPGRIQNDRFDVFCPLMSLPRWLDITLENLPAPRRYLSIPSHVVVSELPGDFKVGVAWAGSPTQQDDKRRSMPLERLGPLFDVGDVDFFSLQMPLSQSEIETLAHHGVKNLEPELPGYARTAALVDQLDVVITVDTAIAHLSGALGKPTWILLHHDPDWRWPREGDRSAWYPTARLFRQEGAGDWTGVVEEVRQELAEHRGVRSRQN